MDVQSHSDSPAGFSLIPVSRDDISTLVEVNAEAFKTDEFNNFMLLGRDPEGHNNAMAKAIELWINDPSSDLIKAVDDAGEILGWCCWTLTPGEAPPQSQPLVDPGLSAGNDADQTGTSAKIKEAASQINTTIAPVAETSSSPGASAGQEEQQPQTAPPSARSLGKLMHEEMVEWERNSIKLKNAEYFALSSMATHPRHRGRGIGYKLVQWGVEKADAQGLPCWAHASPAGSTIYARLGFQELGSSHYNLAEWLPNVETEAQGWGMYIFRYMVRPARAPSDN